MFVLVFIANLILIIVSLVVLPARVAMHFGPGGTPDSWGSKYVSALIFLVVEIPSFLLFYFITPFVFKFPAEWISLPNKDYWLKQENRPVMKVKLESIMLEFGVAFFIFMFCAGLLVTKANLSDPVKLNETLFYPVFTAFMAYVVYWCVKIFRSFKLPKNDDKPSGLPLR